MQSDQATIGRDGPGPVDDAGTHHPVWLGLLGSFRLLRNGQRVSVRSGGKTEALLAQLGLARPQGVARQVLLRAIWPESEESLARNALNNVVLTTRGLLGEALGGATAVIQTAGYYRLNHEAGVAVDVSQFEILAAQSDWYARTGDLTRAASLAERAIHLYRGDLTSRGAEAGVILERDRLRATCLALLMRLADYAFYSGEFGMCLSYALQLLAYDPCREDAHRQVMRCHVRRGERSQALRHYRTVQTILRAELDVEPELATTMLYEQIRLDPGAV